MKSTVTPHFDLLFERYPALNGQKANVEAMYDLLADTYKNGGKLLVCGNGGSCADSEHIVGELMKCFLIKRKIPAQLSEALSAYGEDGEALKTHLEGALPAISLCGHSALTTAYLNDTEPTMTFAQQVVGYGRPGDILLAISTSGNSKNCVYAAEVAKALGMTVIALTGEKDSKLSALADVTFRAPSTETFKIQEYHLPVYHALCAMLEAEFFA
ncbi:MAG: SIS domain-containing protein [Clostridia bacterium]|nr:SIS domain-containing protein [Clostridia bacterium]